jgi:hypothetical protein
MSLQLRDIRRIRGPLAAAAVALVVGATTIVLGQRWEGRLQVAHEAALAAADAAQTKADGAVADRANVATYKSVYDDLRRRGVIGIEQRLPWVEYFTDTSLSGNPVDMTLQIAPRRTLEDAPPTSEPLEGLQFYASKFTLESKLLHDIDALRLLDKLRKVQGASILRQCDLKRASDSANSSTPYLMTMSCEGDIITLDKPAENTGGQP